MIYEVLADSLHSKFSNLSFKKGETITTEQMYPGHDAEWLNIGFIREYQASAENAGDAGTAENIATDNEKEIIPYNHLDQE